MDDGELVRGSGTPDAREPQLEALAEFLKQLFGHLAISQTRYAARCHLDKGTVSRYLSGERIPPQDFVDQLLLHVAEINGHSVTEEVQRQANRLRLEALQVRNKSAYELEVLRQQLGVAEDQLHRARVRERALVDALVQREAEAAKAEQQYRQLEDAWAGTVSEATELAIPQSDQDPRDLEDQLRALQDELEVLRTELARAQKLKATAEKQCLRLEQQLLAAELRLDPAGSTGDEDRLFPALESRHSRYLREAGLRIAHADVDVTAVQAASLMVPEIADFACVALAERLVDDGEHHDQPYQYEVPEQLQRIGSVGVTVSPGESPVAWTGAMALPADNPTLQRLLSGVPAVVDSVSPRAGSDGAVLLGATEAKRFAGWSLLSIPLVINSRLLGLLTLARDPERPLFDDVDGVDLAEFGSRVALHIDNARLREREARTARGLQRSMLPARPPQIPGVKIAHRHAPSSQPSGVGGDWFDALQLPGSRVALVVGDVMGHGLDSAVAMGRFRSAMQTLAALDLPPAQILRHLDNLSQRLGLNHLATCLYAVYDPIARTCTVASAGHLPPVLVHPDGRGELLEIPSGAPIGIGGVPFASREVKVTDGSMLVLCSDSLVELYGGSAGAGLAAVCRDAIDPLHGPAEACDAVLERLQTEYRHDDVALLIARLDGIPWQDVISWSLSLNASEVRRVRGLVRDQLHRWGLEEFADVATLLVSELVTNALRVTRSSVQVEMTRSREGLVFEVSDDDFNLPSLEYSELLDEDGRGLGVVSQLSTRWGVNRKALGKVVWFELATPHQHPHRATLPKE